MYGISASRVLQLLRFIIYYNYEVFYRNTLTVVCCTAICCFPGKFIPTIVFSANQITLACFVSSTITLAFSTRFSYGAAALHLQFRSTITLTWSICKEMIFIPNLLVQMEIIDEAS